jgi:hypothetical protein
VLAAALDVGNVPKHLLELHQRLGRIVQQRRVSVLREKSERVSGRALVSIERREEAIACD